MRFGFGTGRSLASCSSVMGGLTESARAFTSISVSVIVIPDSMVEGHHSCGNTRFSIRNQLPCMIFSMSASL